MKAVNTGKLADKVEKLRVNTGLTPVLEAAGAGPAKIPYNTWKEHGVKLQREQKYKVID
ncbi:UNVERIFIED_ORG: hypothetical protein ABRZ91_002519 [Heyndrickxia coagulans]